ncbi:MBL fold metallo-hydrolase [Paenibacillus caui]|uniref:MBL fold metallo-hydrolase n=1 Tax=Paenibacillus caui TaxID=2873927 RepID=UPI001CA81C4B|nr:MBL fold metallo-hydrolase [Paenibacillus caui]
MELQLQMLGTGNAFAKTNYNNNALVYSNDFTLLIDCGITAPVSLYELGRNWGQIDACLITHIHADHVGGLEEFAFQMKYVYKRRPVLYIAESLVQPLWDHTLKGGMSQENMNTLADFFEVRPLQEGNIYSLFPSLTVQLIRTPHITGKNSYSLVLNGDIFYSADMTFQPELLKKLVYERGVKRIFHECQLIGPGEVHTTLEELKSLPEDIRSLISLMHYGDEFTDFEGKTSGMPFLKQHQIYEL